MKRCRDQIRLHSSAEETNSLAEVLIFVSIQNKWKGVEIKYGSTPRRRNSLAEVLMFVSIQNKLKGVEIKDGSTLWRKWFYRYQIITWPCKLLKQMQKWNTYIPRQLATPNDSVGRGAGVSRRSRTLGTVDLIVVLSFILSLGFLLVSTFWGPLWGVVNQRWDPRWIQWCPTIFPRFSERGHTIGRRPRPPLFDGKIKGLYRYKQMKGVGHPLWWKYQRLYRYKTKWKDVDKRPALLRKCRPNFFGKCPVVWCFESKEKPPLME